WTLWTPVTPEPSFTFLTGFAFRTLRTLFTFRSSVAPEPSFTFRTPFPFRSDMTGGTSRSGELLFINHHILLNPSDNFIHHFFLYVWKYFIRPADFVVNNVNVLTVQGGIYFPRFIHNLRIVTTPFNLRHPECDDTVFHFIVFNVGEIFIIIGYDEKCYIV